MYAESNCKCKQDSKENGTCWRTQNALFRTFVRICSEIMTVPSVTLWTYFLPITETHKVFLSRKGGSQKCLGFRLPGFSALCNKQSKNCTQPLQSLFPREGCVCIMCIGESNFCYIFADSLNYKLIGYNKKLCKRENSELLNKKIEGLITIPADSFNCSSRSNF